MTLRCKPSEYFLGAILRGYDREKACGNPVTASAIWNHICIECVPRRGSFELMFAWDMSKAQSKNRIGTIMETIEAGYVPGLRMGQDAKGRAIVVEADHA